MDLEAGAHDLGIGRDEFLEVLALFVEAGQEDWAALSAAAARGDAAAAAASAHSLKGAALNLGLTELAALALEAETTAKAGRLGELAATLRALETQLAEVARLVAGLRD